MEIVAKISKISRIDFRYRHSAQDVLPKKEAAEEQEQDLESPDDVDDPLLIREKKGRIVMGRAHRLFHRSVAAEPSKVSTVIVDVITTLDSTGNVVPLATSTPGLATVQTVSSGLVVPTVPSVPPFPSDLTVPAYPWPSGVPTAQPSASSADSLTSPSPTSTSGASSIVSSVMPSSSGLNGTISNSILSSTSLSTLNTTSMSTSWSSASQSFSSTQSSSQTATTSSDSATTSLGGGEEDPANTAAPDPAATGAGGSSNSDSPLETPKVVGSIIGSLAGAAIFLALILFLIRRHKRRLQGGATRQITADDAADSQPMASSGQEMARRRSYVPASTAAFFNRFSGASRSTADTSTTAGGGERGFQRISGRKLPSAFSEGMTSEQFTRDGKLSGVSFLQDDKGFYGGPGLAAAKETGEPSTAGAVERIVTMPSPARTPNIHHAPPPFGTSRNGGSLLSPPNSPNPSIPPPGTLGRSLPSQDGSRNSRFTEDV